MSLLSRPIDQDIDQTFFSSEEPLFDSDVKKKPLMERIKKVDKRVLLMCGVLIFGVLLSLILLVFRGASGSNGAVIVTPTPTPTAEQAKDQIDQLFVELKQDIVRADPAQNSLSFPPVAEDISVNSAK